MTINKTYNRIPVLVFAFVLGAYTGVPISDPEPAGKPITNQHDCSEPCTDEDNQALSSSESESAGNFVAAITQGVLEGLIEGYLHALFYR